MNRRSWVLSGAVLVLALVLAFPLRPLVERTLIVPAAYLFWLAGLLYEFLPQLVWWGAASILAAWIAVRALLPGKTLVRKNSPAARPVQGPVEGLAQWIKKTEGGTYYKWLVAHRLGKLAHRMLAQREADRPRAAFAPLTGADWQPGPDLSAYFETGLYGSFADFPGRAATAGGTPLDLDILHAIEFLESKSETNRGRPY